MPGTQLPKGQPLLLNPGTDNAPYKEIKGKVGLGEADGRVYSHTARNVFIIRYSRYDGRECKIQMHFWGQT